MNFNRPVFTSFKTNNLDIKTVLDLIQEHKSYTNRYKRNYNYYKGNHEILYRQHNDPSKPNNKIIENLPEFVTSIRTGYFSGEPISFSSKDDELEKKVQGILEYADFQDTNNELDEISSIFGHALLLLWIDEDGQTRLSAESPMNNFVVYSNTLDKEPIMGVRYFEYKIEDEKITDIFVYLPTETVQFQVSGEKHRIVDRQPNYFGQVPMIEFIENNERKGCFEDAISIVDAIESILSSTINEIEYFDNAYLHLKNLSATTNEDIQDMKNNRVILTEEDGEVEFITKSINDTYIQNTLDRLTNDFHKITRTPNLTDENFGNNASGVSLKFKLFGLEKDMAKKETKWRKSLQKMLELIVARLNMLGGNFDYKDIRLTFTRSMPTNELEQAQMVSQLSGIVSQETLLTQLDFIEKSKEEMERINKEKQSNFNNDYDFEEVV